MTEQVTITIDKQKAEEISLGLSDLLCWLEGFYAARKGTDLEHDNPMGVGAVRDINIKLKDVIW